ncbi:MAG: sugar phosphate isomerase/epimerase family protein [Acetanaerobacterium sp.]
MKKQLGVQMYTLRGETEKDFAGTLAQAAAAGYAAVEFAGFGSISAKEMAALLKENGLRVSGAHIPIDELESHLDEIAEYLKIIDCRHVVIPVAHFEQRSDIDGLIVKINALMPKIRKAGLILAYHNHAKEFEKVDGVRPIDALLEDSQVMLEIDTFWAHTAGEDISSFLRRNRARIALVHLKDGTDGKPCAIGEGTTPCKRIYDLAKELNFSHIIVENDAPEPNGIDDITRSMHYIIEHF